MFLPERHDRFRLAWEKEGFDEEKVLVVLCVVFMLSVAAGCGVRAWRPWSVCIRGKQYDAAIENEVIKMKGNSSEEGSHQKMGWMDRWPPDGN